MTFATLVACLSCVYGGMLISNTSVKVLPRRGVMSAITWTNGITLVQGQLVTYQNRYYMAEVSGVSSTTPTHMSGVTANLRFVPSTLRQACIIHNGSDNSTAWIDVDSYAAEYKGFRLPPNATASFEGYQNAFHAIAPSGDLYLSITEVEK